MSQPYLDIRRFASPVGLFFMAMTLFVSLGAQAEAETGDAIVAGPTPLPPDSPAPAAPAPAPAPAAPIVYPPSLTTDPEKACYRTYLSDQAICTSAYNTSVAGCDSASTNYFSRQACYLGAYFTWDACTGGSFGGAGAKYGACLSAAWKQVGKYQAQ